MKPKLLISFYLETDGQTKNANNALKDYLRVYINYKQDNWADLLLITKFKVNLKKSELTGILPFIVIKGYKPRAGFKTPIKWEKLILLVA